MEDQIYGIARKALRCIEVLRKNQINKTQQTTNLSIRKSPRETRRATGGDDDSASEGCGREREITMDYTQKIHISSQIPSIVEHFPLCEHEEVLLLLPASHEGGVGHRRGLETWLRR